MGYHYIPRYYLRGFFAPDSEYIWTYQKGKPRPFQTGVATVANEKGFYTDEVEQYLTNEIENPAQSIIAKIRQRQFPNQEEKLILARYMVAMLKRVPESKERLKAHAPQAIANVRSELFQEIDEAAQLEPENAAHFDRLKHKADELLAGYEQQVPKEIWLANIPPERSPRIINVLANMTWQFWVHGSRPAFITSDNPVFFFTGIGMGKQESEVVFPISSQIALWATWRRDVQEFRHANRKIIDEVNNRLVSEATRFVFAPLEKKWLSTLLNQQERIKLNRIV